MPNTFPLAYNFKRRSKFNTVTDAMVDGQQWYTIEIDFFSPEVSSWVRQQEQEFIYEHRGYSQSRFVNAVFDVHESIYTLMALKF